MSDRYEKTYRSPTRIRLTIACIYLTNYYKSDDQGVIGKARDMLDEHNLDLDVWPTYGLKTPQNTIDYGSDLVQHNSAAYKALREAVDNQIRKARCPFICPLPIVFCQFASGGLGVTPYAMKKITHSCLVSPNPNADRVTLVHEMGHAAELQHEEGDLNRGNFMHEADPRSFMYRYQVEAMASAWYAVG